MVRTPDTIFDPPDEPPDEELTPRQLHDRWESSTNLDAAQLERFKDSPFNEVYKTQNSAQAQPGDEPLDDAIQLAETPADEWRDLDDGFNEVEEAEEALDWIDRHGSQARDGLGTNFLTDERKVTRREAAGIRWGVDWDGDIEW
jgi:hypothetical protein